MPNNSCQALTGGFRASALALDLRLRLEDDGSGDQYMRRTTGYIGCASHQSKSPMMISATVVAFLVAPSWGGPESAAAPLEGKKEPFHLTGD